MFRKYFSIFIIFFIVFSLEPHATEMQNNVADQSTKNIGIEPKNTLYIELKDGVVIAELFPKIAPMHVQRIRTLADDGFYDNLKFHRVIDGFMAQTGDPTGTGRGGSRLGKLYAEFNDEHHTRGTLSMARASDPNSANSQFFIVTGDFFPQLDNQYTIFGRVIEGMEYVDKIKAGDTANNGIVENPDVMVKVITGDMLNNKPLEVVKEEIKVINDMQIQKLKDDPNYKKKSVLELLLNTKDIDIGETDEQKPSTNKPEDTDVSATETKTADPNSAPTADKTSGGASQLAPSETVSPQPGNAPTSPAQPAQNDGVSQQGQLQVPQAGVTTVEQPSNPTTNQNVNTPKPNGNVK